MSKIIFLGTAGSTAVVNKQLRSSGGIILQIENLQFHIDPGPGAIRQAKEAGVNLHHTSTVLVSHNHLNHCNDLNIIIDAMTHSGIEQRGIVISSRSVIQGDGQNRPFLAEYYRSLVERVIPAEKNHKIAIDLVEINTLSAKHTDPSALGFKFFCPKFTLSYTGDTALTEELLGELAGSDILILNVPFSGKNGKGLNLDTEGAITIISQVRPRLAVITHFGLDMLKADPIQEAREIQRITGIHTIAAKDGLAITPESHSVQKSPIRGFD